MRKGARYRQRFHKGAEKHGAGTERKLTATMSGDAKHGRTDYTMTDTTQVVQMAPPPMPSIKLVVFTRDGHTFTFRNVGEWSTNEMNLTFDYKAMSDGTARRGQFFMRNLAGFSINA